MIGRAARTVVVGSGPVQTAPRAPVSNGPEGLLDRALELLKRLNGMRGADGARVSSRVVVDGFEPWWFVQEELFWGALVPYTAHRDICLRAMRGEPVETSGGMPEATRLLGWLTALSKGSQPGKLLAPPMPPYARLTWQGLRLTSWVSLAVFRATGRETLLYSIDKLSPGLDHDFRIGRVYRELRRRGYRFGEYLHVSDLRQTWRNLLRRGRPAVFFETLAAPMTAGPSFPASSSAQADLDDPDGEFLQTLACLALEMVEASVREYRTLKRALKLHRAKRAVVLDDSRHANELVAACKAMGIPVVGYMHGLLNRHHPGLMAYGLETGRRHTFDLYGVWSEYFRARLLKGDLYEAGNTLACGPLRPPAEDELRAIGETPRQSKSGILRLLLVSEPRVPWAEVDRYVERLLEDGRFEVVVKLRPGEQRDFAGEGVRMQPRVIRGGTVYDALREIDVVAGCYSTMLYEAILALRPAVVLKSSFSYGRELAHDGLAEFADSPEVVAETVLRASRLSNAELARRRTAVWGDRIQDGASALFDAAEARLWGRPND